MSNCFPSTDRWLDDVGASEKYDRRRAYDERKRKEGIVRVRSAVPRQHVEKIKAFARFLRNCPDDHIAQYQQDFEEYQREAWADYDDAVAAGRFNPNEPDGDD